MILSKKLIKKIIESSNGYIEISGNSMIPTYHNGDKVKVISPTYLSSGDIVVYYQNQNLIIHRIIDMYKNIIITKGDNNKLCDNPINIDQVIGKVLTEPKHSSRKLKRRIIYNFWNKELYEESKDYLNLLGIEVFILPDQYFDHCFNIGICDVSIDSFQTVINLASDQMICIHLGAKISDHVIPGFVLDTFFDAVCNINGAAASCYMTNKEKLQYLVFKHGT